jgi:hypothetical protein
MVRDIGKISFHVVHDRRGTIPVDEHFGAEVKVTTIDGKIVSGKIDATSANPLPAERLREKFENCIGRALPVSRAAALAEMIEQLETLADMRAVSALLCGDTAGRVRKTHFG